MTGLRFVAAFVVLNFHMLGALYFKSPISAMTHAFVQGPVGVSFFFILSGFVLTWSHSPGDGPGAFYRRRFARIGPLHVATWALAGVLLFVFFSLPSAAAMVAALLLLVPWIPGYSYQPPMNGPSWSLGCEMFFYALFPVLLVRAQKLSRQARRLGMAALILLVFLFAAASVPDHANTPSAWALYFFPPVRLVEFALGILLAKEVQDGKLPRVSLLGASLLALAAYTVDSWAPRPLQPVAVTVVPFALLIVAAAQADVARTRSLWRTAPMVRLGTWSFALYMIHAPILLVYSHYIRGQLNDGQTVVVGMSIVAAAIASSAFLYRFVERPLEARLRPKRRPMMEPALAPLAEN